MGSTKIAIMSVIAVVVVSVVMMGGPTEAAITCGQVVNSLIPCITYVQNGGAVPKACCDGVKGLYAAAKTTPDRQQVCHCLKNAVNGFSYNKTNLALAAGLPSKCGVSIPYKINPSTDCKSVT